MKHLLTMGDEFIPNDRMQTGSAVHWLIEVAEQNKRQPTKGEWGKVAKEWPLASRSEVEEYFNGYIKHQDELKGDYGKVVEIEGKGVYRLPPASFDPTQKEIVITVTRDQLRLNSDGEYTLIDFKVSTQPIGDMVRTYALQLAVYQLSIVQQFKTDAVTSYIVNPLLMAKPRSLWFARVKFDHDRCSAMLRAVQTHVAAIRAGAPVRQPGYGCGRCPARSPEYC